MFKKNNNNYHIFLPISHTFCLIRMPCDLYVEATCFFFPVFIKNEQMIERLFLIYCRLLPY